VVGDAQQPAAGGTGWRVAAGSWSLVELGLTGVWLGVRGTSVVPGLDGWWQPTLSSRQLAGPDGG
jgi:hypothetical protein